MSKATYTSEDSLGFLVGQAHRALSRRLNRNFCEKELDVTPEQWFMLMNLWENEGVNQQELTNCTGKDKTTITRLLDGLEKRALVVRASGSDDRRVKLVYLTQKGKQLREALIEQAIKTLEEGQKGVAPAELDICKKVLRQVLHNLCSE